MAAALRLTPTAPAVRPGSRPRMPHVAAWSPALSTAELEAKAREVVAAGVAKWGAGGE